MVSCLAGWAGSCLLCRACCLWLNCAGMCGAEIVSIKLRLSSTLAADASSCWQLPCMLEMVVACVWLESEAASWLGFCPVRLWCMTRLSASALGIECRLSDKLLTVLLLTVLPTLCWPCCQCKSLSQQAATGGVLWQVPPTTVVFQKMTGTCGPLAWSPALCSTVHAHAVQYTRCGVKFSNSCIQ